MTSRLVRELGDTIAAISTPIGLGGIGIVRVSGNHALDIVSRIFVGRKDLHTIRSHTLVYGRIVDGNRILDEVLVSVMRGSRSYTGETVVEINCHGGVGVTKAILEAVLRNGVRLAKRGEFTKRAYLNGRIGLTEAEAVADLIEADSLGAIRNAIALLGGKLHREVELIGEKLRSVLVSLEFSLDFDEDEGEALAILEEKLEKCANKLKKLIESYDRGRLLKSGLKVTIIGKPNVGKSSLLNAILREERVIVSPIPGTTRDIIQERIQIDGMLILLSDTAGLSEETDSLTGILEKEGMKRTRQQITEADILLVVLDSSGYLEVEDEVMARDSESNKRIVVLNKCDLEARICRRQVGSLFRTADFVEVSALFRWGVEEIGKKIVDIVSDMVSGSNGDFTITSDRHKACFEDVLQHVLYAIVGLKNRMSIEFVALDVREALDRLGEIIGETTSEDILDSIFESFCVGK